MIIKFYRTIPFLLILPALLTSCKGRKMALESNKALTELGVGVNQKMVKNSFDFDHISMKIKANYKEGNLNQSFTMHVKMIQDTAIWVSVSAFGIEVSRAMITQDSFKLIDRIRKRYVMGGVEELKRYTQHDFTLSQLQQLLVGNTLFDGDVYDKKHDDLREDHLVYSDSSLWNALILTEGFRLKSSELTNTENTQKALVDYEEYKRVKKAGSLPTKLEVGLDGDGRRMELTMNYVTVSLSHISKLSFTIPSKYAKSM